TCDDEPVVPRTTNAPIHRSGFSGEWCAGGQGRSRGRGQGEDRYHGHAAAECGQREVPQGTRADVSVAEHAGSPHRCGPAGPGPGGLANLTNELAVAEKASGKTASVTSKELAKMAAELAKMRRKESELQAVVVAQQQLTGADDTIAILKQTL